MRGVGRVAVSSTFLAAGSASRSLNSRGARLPSAQRSVSRSFVYLTRIADPYHSVGAGVGGAPKKGDAAIDHRRYWKERVVGHVLDGPTRGSVALDMFVLDRSLVEHYERFACSFSKIRSPKSRIRSTAPLPISASGPSRW